MCSTYVYVLSFLNPKLLNYIPTFIFQTTQTLFQTSDIHGFNKGFVTVFDNLT